MKASIKLERDEIEWLAAWIRGIVEATPVEFFELESFCVAWLYQRLLGRFTFIKAAKLPFLMSEALALKRLLLNWPMMTEYDDFMRNTIIAKIEKKCPYL